LQDILLEQVDFLNLHKMLSRNVRYTFLATGVFPPLRNTTGATLEFKWLFKKEFVSTSNQHLTKKVNSGLLLLFLLSYKQFT
jgi:hypothetical protein